MRVPVQQRESEGLATDALSLALRLERRRMGRFSQVPLEEPLHVSLGELSARHERAHRRLPVGDEAMRVLALGKSGVLCLGQRYTGHEEGIA